MKSTDKGKTVGSAELQQRGELLKEYNAATKPIYRLKQLQQQLNELPDKINTLINYANETNSISELIATIQSEDLSLLAIKITEIKTKLASTLSDVNKLSLKNDLHELKANSYLQQIKIAGETKDVGSPEEVNKATQALLRATIKTMQLQRSDIPLEVEYLQAMLPKSYSQLSQIRRSLIAIENNPVNHFPTPSSATNLTRLYIELQAHCSLKEKATEIDYLVSLPNLLKAYSIYMRNAESADQCDFIDGENSAQPILDKLYKLLGCNGLMALTPKLAQTLNSNEYTIDFSTLTSPIEIAEVIAVRAQNDLNNRRDIRINHTRLSCYLLIARVFYIHNDNPVQSTYMQVLDGYSRMLNANIEVRMQGLELLESAQESLHQKLKLPSLNMKNRFQLSLIQGVCCYYLARSRYVPGMKDLIKVKNLLKTADDSFNPQQLDYCLTSISYSPFIRSCNDKVVNLLINVRREEIEEFKKCTRFPTKLTEKKHKLEALKNRRYLRNVLASKEDRTDTENGKLTIYEISNKDLNFFANLKKQQYQDLLTNGLAIYNEDAKNYRAAIYCFSMYRFHTNQFNDGDYDAGVFKVREFAKFVLTECYIRTAYEICDDATLTNFYFLVAEKLCTSIIDRSARSCLTISTSDKQILTLAGIAFNLRQRIKAVLGRPSLEEFTLATPLDENLLISEADIAPLELAHINVTADYMPEPEAATKKNTEISQLFRDDAAPVTTDNNGAELIELAARVVNSTH